MRARLGVLSGVTPQPVGPHEWECGSEFTKCKTCGASYRHQYTKGMSTKEQDDWCWKDFPPSMFRRTNEDAHVFLIALRRLGGKRDIAEVEECAAACGFRDRNLNDGFWFLQSVGVVGLDDKWLAYIVVE